MILTLEDLTKFSKPATVFSKTLYYACVHANIDTPRRMQFFMSQVAHESAGFHFLEENLDYSASALLRVFPTHFNSSNVDAYNRQPEKIANHVYANRMGNGDEASGDGWKYRGRSLLQLTFKDNYAEFSQVMGIDAVNNPDLLATKDYAASPAAFFWNKFGLNKFADDNDFEGQRRAVNGGLNGLEDCEKWLRVAETIWV